MSSPFYNAPMDRQQHRRISGDNEQSWHYQSFFNAQRGRDSDRQNFSNPFPHHNSRYNQLDREAIDFQDDFAINSRNPRQRQVPDRGFKEFQSRKRSYDLTGSLNEHSAEFEPPRLTKPFNLGISSINRVEEARRKKVLDGKAAEERSKLEQEERKKYQCVKEGVVCLISPVTIAELKRKIVHHKFDSKLVDEVCQFHARYQYNLKFKGEKYAKRYSEKQLPNPNRRVCCAVCDLYFSEECEYTTHCKTCLHCEVEAIYIRLKSLAQDWFDFKKNQNHSLSSSSKLAERVGLIIKFKTGKEDDEDIFSHLNISEMDMDSFRLVIFERGMKNIWPQPTAAFFCRTCNYCEFQSQRQLDRHKQSARHLEYERHYEDAFCVVCQKHNGDKQAMTNHQLSVEHSQAETVMRFYRVLAEEYYHMLGSGEIIPTFKKTENERTVHELEETKCNDSQTNCEVLDNQRPKDNSVKQNNLATEPIIGERNMDILINKTYSDQFVQTVSRPSEDIVYCVNCIHIRRKQADQITQLLELEHRNRVLEEQLKISEQKNKEFEQMKLEKRKETSKKPLVLDDFIVQLSGYMCTVCHETSHTDKEATMHMNSIGHQGKVKSHKEVFKLT